MIGFIVAGLVIGALARLIKPGKQNLSIAMTLLLGLAGSVIGGLVAAVALIGVFEGLSHRRATAPGVDGSRTDPRIPS
jgi:uncharacterized membrane protein YeaQ/YmgE (transglycosylase-associated protein family)